MNQGLQLGLLVVQRLAELQKLQITPKSMADRRRTVPECLVDLDVPRLRWGQIRPKGTQDQVAILKWIPTPLRGGKPKFGIRLG